MSDDQRARLLARAAALKGRPEIERCYVLTSLLAENLVGRTVSEGEMFTAAYGESDGRTYWEVHLSETVRLLALVELLATHLAEDADRKRVWRLAVLGAMRDAMIAGEPFVTRTAATSRDRLVAANSDRSIDSVADLSRVAVEHYRQSDNGDAWAEAIMIEPRAAVRWLLEKPKRKHLLPPGLKAFLEGSGSSDAQDEPDAAAPDYIRSGTPGRPSKSIHLIKAEFERRLDAGAITSTAAAAADLRSWLTVEHPTAEPPTKKTIANQIPQWRRDAERPTGNCPK